MGTDISLFVEFKWFDKRWGVVGSEFLVWRRYSFLLTLPVFVITTMYYRSQPIAACRRMRLKMSGLHGLTIAGIVLLGVL